MSVSAAIVELTRQAADAKQAADDQVKQIRSEIKRLRTDLNAARIAPAPIEEAAATTFAAVVRQRGGSYIDEHAGWFLPSEHGRSILTVGAGAAARLPPNINSFDALCAGAPDLAERMLRTLAEKAMTQEGRSAGSSAQERPAQLARLTRELEQLERDEEALVDDLQAAGIALAHRPEVTDRRRREQEQQARRDQQERDQLERQRQIDERDQEGQQIIRPRARGEAQQPGDTIIVRGR